MGYTSLVMLPISESSLRLMKRIFLTLGVLFFVGGSYYISKNYTIIHLTDAQMAQVNTPGLQSSALGGVSAGE